MSQEWHFCADESNRVSADKTYYADRDHPDLADCMEICGTYNPPEEAERVGGDETCAVVKNDGEVCGRDLPCPYHSED